MNPETQFAKGADDSEESRMRITYRNLDRLHPHARYPVIHQAQATGGEQSLSLTPAEAHWVVAVLTRLLRES